MKPAEPRVSIDPVRPIPPRGWLFKRMVLAAAALAVVMTPLWLAWNRTASRRLAARVALLHSRGEPVYRDDFISPALPDDQNAAVLLKAAGAAIPDDPVCPNSSNLTFPQYPPFPAPWRSMIDAAMAANRRPLRLARAARPLNRAIWYAVPPSPVLTNLHMPYFNQQRELANLLGDTAMAAHVDGNDAEAIERIRDIFHQADMLDQSDFTVIHRLVAIGISALAQARLQVIASDGLRIASNSVSPATGPAHPVQRQVILDLIRYLLDDQPQIAAERRSVQGERMMHLDLLDWDARRALLLSPMLRLDAVHLIDADGTVLRAAAQPDWPAAQSILRARQTAERAASGADIARPMSSNSFLRDDRYLLTYFRTNADRKALAAILALRLYHVDYNHWPQQLSELVPHYLPAVPPDLFRPGAPPLGYTVENDPTVSPDPRPLIFFGASAAATNPSPSISPCIGWQNGGAVQWRDVTRWRPAPEPSH